MRGGGRHNAENAEAQRAAEKSQERTLHENQISEKIIGCAIEVHRQLGPGLLESVYEEALCYELSQAGLRFQRQEEVSINYKGVLLRAPLRLDLIVEVSKGRSLSTTSRRPISHQWISNVC